MRDYFVFYHTDISNWFFKTQSSSHYTIKIYLYIVFLACIYKKNIFELLSVVYHIFPSFLHCYLLIVISLPTILIVHFLKLLEAIAISNPYLTRYCFFLSENYILLEERKLCREQYRKEAMNQCSVQKMYQYKN